MFNFQKALTNVVDSYYNVKGFLVFANLPEDSGTQESTAVIRLPVYDISSTLQEINFNVMCDGENVIINMETTQNFLIDRVVYNIKEVSITVKDGVFDMALDRLLGRYGLKPSRNTLLSKTKVGHFASLVNLSPYTKKRKVYFENTTDNVYIWREVTFNRERLLSLDMLNYKDMKSTLIYMMVRKGVTRTEDSLRVRGNVDEVLTKAKQIKETLLQQLQEGE